MLAAVLTRAALQLVLPGIPPFITLYPGMALAGLLCGPAAGGAAAVLGLAAAIYLCFPPRLGFAVAGMTEGVAVGLFVVASIIVLSAAAVLRARLAAASVATQALDLGLMAGGVGVWDYNLGTGRITASGGAYRLHGLPDGTRRTVAEDWLRDIPPDDAEVARRALQAAVADGTLATYTYRILGAPDGPRWIAARGRVVSVAGERRLLCALVDITEQVRVQEELRRERERLRLALEAGALAVWDHEPATGKSKIDARYAATMGFPPELKILTLEQVAERIHPDDLPRVAAEHAALVASGADYHIEFRIVTPSGDIRWLLSQGILVKGKAPPDPGRLVGILQDITNRKRREHDLAGLAAARELLVREADHRIKNSLQLVMSLLTAQLRGIEDPAAANALREAITRVGAIAASHLALQGSKDLRHVDVAVTLRELCGHFASLNPAVTILCRPGEALMLDADRAIPLGLAVSEIITNALRHAFADRAAGTVVVEAKTDPTHLIVRVSDNGVGIPADFESDGLGSRIVRSLAAQVGATLHFASTAEAGTAVTLRLPLPQPGTPAQA